MTAMMRLLVLALVFVAAAALLPAWVSAHGGDAGVIHACVHRSSDQVRIVGPNDGCRNAENPIHWSASGGPAGPQGPQGPPGPAGSPGAPGQCTAGCSGGTIQGRLVSCTPQDFTGILVYVPGTSFIAIAAADGSFAIRNVVEGTHGLVVQQPGQSAATVQDPIAVTDGQVSAAGDIVVSDTSTDPQNCGACGNVCGGGQNATAACVAGSCTIGGCGTGFADCDGSAVNGCETSVLADEANCGGCGLTCSSSQFCSQGLCRPQCPPGTTLSCGGEICLGPGQLCP
jgi:hypothetical protein